MKQSIDDFMSKMLEDNIIRTGPSAASMGEKVGQKMEKAVKELTQKYEDQEQPDIDEASEPDETDDIETGADGGDMDEIEE